MSVTEDSLGIFYGGEEKSGILAYAFWPGNVTCMPNFPFKAWPSDIEHKTYQFRGEKWTVLLWEIHIQTWPDAERWETALETTLKSMIKRNAIIAWLGTEGTFVDYPMLFDPKFMNGSVYAILTKNSGFINRAHLGHSIGYFNDVELLEFKKALSSAVSAFVD